MSMVRKCIIGFVEISVLISIAWLVFCFRLSFSRQKNDTAKYSYCFNTITFSKLTYYTRWNKCFQMQEADIILLLKSTSTKTEKSHFP